MLCYQYGSEAWIARITIVLTERCLPTKGPAVADPQYVINYT
jgi:hypothetical protein